MLSPFLLALCGHMGSHAFDVEYARPRLISSSALRLGRDELPLVARNTSSAALPERFDAREVWSRCESIGDIWDQSACGDCWAVATVTAASDRLCIAGGPDTMRLSVEHMVGCCHVCGYGCGDGFPNYAWQWLAGMKGSPYGLVTGGPYGDTTWCSAYSLEPCNHFNSPGAESLPSCSANPKPTPACPAACDAESSYAVPFAQDIQQFASAYAVPADEASIRAEIQAHGPVTAGFTVYESWTQYSGGVYQPSCCYGYCPEGDELGSHAVRIIGWGVEDGVNYWLVSNSYGTKWGDKGYFKIKRGSNTCGIEGSVVAGLAGSSATLSV